MTVLITGGARGIGQSLVEEFARAGHAVAFTFHSSSDAADTLVAQLTGEGHTARAYPCDVRDFAAVEQLIAQVEEDLGPIQTLVNNAGVRQDGAFHRMSPDAWKDVLDANLTGVFHCCRALGPQLIRRGGAVVNMTSAAGVAGMPGQVNYCAAKAGVIGLTKALAKEWARLNVRVNAIAPGYIDAGMTESLGELKLKKLLAQVPMSKMGSAREVARLALFLASDDAGYITGQVIPVDGGLV